MKNFLQSVFFVFFIFSTFSSVAQSTQVCYGNLRCLAGSTCNDTRDTIWVCKGYKVKFRGSTQVHCNFGGNDIYIPSEKLTSYTVDRDNNRICTNRADPLITGPNITQQKPNKVYGDVGGTGTCENAYIYYLDAEAVINESGLYSIEWEQTVSRWNHGTGTYDVNTTKYISSTYYGVKGGGAVPSITVSKNKANTGERVTVTPSINYTYPNSADNSLTLYSDDCSSVYPQYTSSVPKKVNIYAQGIDNGCLTPKSTPQEVIFKPCGRESFGFYDTALEAQVLDVERKTCNANSQGRQDYHFYDIEKTLCNRSTQCSINNIWNLYKSKISNQAPIASDFVPFVSSPDIRMIATAIFIPPYDPNSSITSGIKVDLFAPEAVAFKTGAYYVSRGNGFARITYNLIETFDGFPKNYSNPIALYIDEANKCITNYTLPGHSLYPGKVTRCIVEECGQIKVKTFGEGITNVGDNWLGSSFAYINDKAGRGLFSNVDDRFAALVKQTYPQRIIQDLTKEALTNLGIENKNWIVKEFRITDNSEDFFGTK